MRFPIESMPRQLSGLTCDINKIIESCTKPLKNHVCRRNASLSSGAWLERQRKDVYKKMARYDHYRARSAYKLIEIDDKYKFLKPGKVVIEAGSAPGSWTQVICERLQLKDEDTKKISKTSSICIAVDLANMDPVKGAICLGNADVTSPFTQGKILTWLDSRKVDVVLSDMAPNSTGQGYLNHERIVTLVKSLLGFALQVLKPGDGVFVFKLWDGAETRDLVDKLRRHFKHVRQVKPDASRDDSAELYIVCRNFISADPSPLVTRETEGP